MEYATLAIHTECYWLLEHIFSNQIDAAIKAEAFQVRKIVKDGTKATITIEDGNKRIIKTFQISYTVFLWKNILFGWWMGCYYLKMSISIEQIKI